MRRPMAIPVLAALLAAALAPMALAAQGQLPSGQVAAPVGNPGSADPLREARDLLAASDDARGALSLLDRSIAGPVLPKAQARDLAVLRIGLLVRVGRCEEALSALASPPPVGLAADVLDPDYRLLKAKAYYRLGRPAQAIAELAAAAERFPADPRLARLFFSHANPLPHGDAERALGELFLKRLPRLAEADPELLVLAAPFMLDEAARADSVRAYRARGLSSPESTLLALEYGIIGDAAAAREFLGFRQALDRAELERLSSLMGSEAGRGALRSALAAFTGRVATDADGDGQAEAVASYEKGNLVGWTRDADQDGRPEYRVAFREGRLWEAAVAAGGLSASLSWSEYPYVETINYGDVAYRFGPEALLWAPLRYVGVSDEADGPLFLVEDSGAPLPGEAASLAVALEADRRDGDLLDVTSLDHGVPLRRERLVAGKPEAILDYQGGRPSVETVDADGDGFFETLRLWNEGGGTEASTVRVDADRDGIYEYREDLAFPHLKEWDLDHDGRMDTRQTELAGGGLLREFSSRLDGRFDEAIELDASGSVVSVSREGKKAFLVQDANPQLRWIGAKPFDLGSSLPASEGIYARGSKRYRLVYAGARAFAELLP